VLAAKTAGTLHLCELAQRHPSIQFVLLYSSVAATFGSPGQAGYAAANGFMDGLAHRLRRQGLPVTSVAWGPWAGPGMAADARIPGLPAMPPDEASSLLDVVLDDDGPHRLAMALDANRFAESFPAAAPLLSAGAAASSTTSTPRLRQPPRAPSAPQPAPDRAAPPRRPAREVIQRAMAAVLFTTPGEIDLTRPFMHLGLDSLTALDVRNRVQAELGIEIPITAVWNYPTVQRLAEHLEERLAAPPPARAAAAGDGAGDGEDLGDLGAAIAAAIAEVERAATDDGAAAIGS
jgi:acyl carrier protein